MLFLITKLLERLVVFSQPLDRNGILKENLPAIMCK